MRNMTPQRWVAFVTAVVFLAGCAGSGSDSAEQADGITTVGGYGSTAAQTARLKEARRSGGTSLAVELRDTHNQPVGVAVVGPAPKNRLRIELDVDLAPRFFPAKVVIYGHETSGFTEECDEISVVASTGGANDIPGIAELLDAGVFSAPKSTRSFNASFRAITGAADSIAIWFGGNGSFLLACGDF